MTYYYVVVTGCTDPSCEPVVSHEHAVHRYCEDVKNGELTEGEDCAFVMAIGKDGSPSMYPFESSEIDEALGN